MGYVAICGGGHRVGSRRCHPDDKGGGQKEAVAREKEKIKGAVCTDFILSAEIIAITLGTVEDADFLQQVIVLSGISIIMTFGVYGLDFRLCVFVPAALLHLPV